MAKQGANSSVKEEKIENTILGVEKRDSEIIRKALEGDTSNEDAQKPTISNKEKTMKKVGIILRLICIFVIFGFIGYGVYNVFSWTGVVIYSLIVLTLCGGIGSMDEPYINE